MSSIKLGEVFASGFSTKNSQLHGGSESNLGWGCFNFCCRAYPLFKALNIILGIYGIGISEDTNQPSKNDRQRLRVNSVLQKFFSSTKLPK